MTQPAPEPPEFVGHCLIRLAVVSAALTGGGIFLLTDWTMGSVFRIATGMCLGAFACSTVGLVKRADLPAKWSWFKLSAAFLFAGLTTALLGIVFR